MCVDVSAGRRQFVRTNRHDERRVDGRGGSRKCVVEVKFAVRTTPPCPPGSTTPQGPQPVRVGATHFHLRGRNTLPSPSQHSLHRALLLVG